VLSKVGENCWKVSFVDYGNTSEVSIADMRLLKEEHASVPALSINCLLRGCGKSDWPEEEVDKFDATTNEFDFDVIN
jgi:Tudor domain